MHRRRLIQRDDETVTKPDDEAITVVGPIRGSLVGGWLAPIVGVLSHRHRIGGALRLLQNRST